MVIYLTIGIAIFLLILAGVLFATGDVLSEFQESFLYLVAGLFILLIGAAVYLSFATPILASGEAGTGLFERKKDTVITQDEMNGLELLYEE